MCLSIDGTRIHYRQFDRMRRHADFRAKNSCVLNIQGYKCTHTDRYYDLRKEKKEKI